MSYIRYPVPSHDPPGLGNVSRVYAALTTPEGPQTHSGAAALDLTFTVDTSGTARQRARVVRGRDAHFHQQVELGSRAFRVKKFNAGVVDLALTLTVDSAGIAKHFAAADVPLTFTFDTSGASTTRPKVIRQPLEAHSPQQRQLDSRFSKPLARHAGAADLPLTLGISTDGTSTTPQVSRKVHRALEAHSYPDPQPVSQTLQPLTALNVVTGSAALDLTLNIATEGTSSSPQTPRVGVAVAGGTNLGGKVRAIEQDGPVTPLLESRGFVYYHAAPPIYRVIVPGSTNQSFTANPVVQAPAEVPVPSRRFRGYAGPTTHSGAVDLGLTFNVSTDGTRRTRPTVTQGKTPFQYAQFELGSRRYKGFAGAATHNGAVDLGLTLTVDTSGRITVRRSSVTTPLTLDIATAGYAVKRSSVTLPLAFNVDTVGRVAMRSSVTLPIVLTIGTDGDILGAGLTGHFDRPTPGGQSRISTGAGAFDRPTPGRSA
jgi:hypothetical protein